MGVSVFIHFPRRLANLELIICRGREKRNRCYAHAARNRKSWPLGGYKEREVEYTPLLPISRNTISNLLRRLRSRWRMEEVAVYTKWKFSLARNGARKYRGETGLTSGRRAARRCFYRKA